MQLFSKACEHGIKAIIYIATRSIEGQRVKTGDVAREIGSPEAYTGKILGMLNKHQILTSQTGPNGGFEITPERMKTIRMSDVVMAIDGDAVFNGCGLGLDECSNVQPCPMHSKFVILRSQVKKMLKESTIYDLAIGLKSGKSVLIR